MGLEQTVTFPRGTVPLWCQVSDLLGRRDYPVQVRMIDGNLALPEEAVPEAWRELRVGAPPGMITVKRAGDRVTLGVWSNADEELRQAWNALAWAFAQLGGGRILAPEGPYSLAEFCESAALPEAIKAAP
jgi:hypothetical protein